MRTFLDIETLPSLAPDARELARAGVKPPANYKKPETIAEWWKTEGETAAETVWRKGALDGAVGELCAVGFAADDRTDLQAQYTYYLTDNINPGLSAYSQPYGAGTEEHGVLASIIRRINPKLRLTLRYGFFTSRSDMAGGYNDYDAHFIYSSAQYLF